MGTKEDAWQPPHPAAQILRLKDLTNIYPLSRNAIFHAMDHEGFPKPIKLSSRSKGWWKAEIEEWFANRPRDATPCAVPLA